MLRACTAARRLCGAADDRRGRATAARRTSPYAATSERALPWLKCAWWAERGQHREAGMRSGVALRGPSSITASVRAAAASALRHAASACSKAPKGSGKVRRLRLETGALRLQPLHASLRDKPHRRALRDHAPGPSALASAARREPHTQPSLRGELACSQPVCREEAPCAAPAAASACTATRLSRLGAPSRLHAAVSHPGSPSVGRAVA